MVPPSPSSGSDLEWVIHRALERIGSVLTHGERFVANNVLNLTPDARSMYAKLLARKYAIVRTSTVSHLNVLNEAGLVDGLVLWRERAERSTLTELRVGAKMLGLPTTGNRPTLVERLGVHTHWSQTSWSRTRYRSLMYRFLQAARLHPFPEYHTAVVERLGHVRWATFVVEPSPPPFTRRGPYRRWIATWKLLCEDTPNVHALVDALRYGHGRSWGRLDLTRRLARRLLSASRSAEATSPEIAVAGYNHLLGHPNVAVEARLRLAHVLEKNRRPLEAWNTLEGFLSQGSARRQMLRQRKRLGRVLGRKAPPDPPDPPMHERRLRLVSRGRKKNRPLFEGDLHVEPATVAHIANCGRTALHAEGALWRHLLTLMLLPDAWFAPVGQLPSRYLAGPLDLGRPEFAIRRVGAIQRVQRRIQNDLEGLIRESHDRFFGCRIRGVRWNPLELDLRVAQSLQPALPLVLDTFLRDGRASLRGLPDLVLLAGSPAKIPSAHPSKLSDAPMLIELKTPGDRLSDAQRWWMAKLRGVIRVELWHVRPVAADPGVT